MESRSFVLRPFFLIGIMSVLLLVVPRSFSQGIVVDHTCVDLTRIPGVWIDQVKASIKLQFCHTSHGLQLKAGLERLANPALPGYDPRLVYTHAWKTLPAGPGLCIMGGQTTEFYTTPEQYWRAGGDSLTRATLGKFKAINVSMFCWCRELDNYSEADVNAYIETISRLENAYPGVKFVYMTGNAQATGPGGYNRSLRNEQIREYCRENNKILFDFADLDVWYQGDQGSYVYNGINVPIEHPFYLGDDAGHTTFLSCETKARALWWLLARLSGWDPDQGASDCDGNGDGVVDRRDFFLKRMQILAELSDRIRIWGYEKQKVDIVLDRIDFLKRRQAALFELRTWAKRCGLAADK